MKYIPTYFALANPTSLSGLVPASSLFIGVKSTERVNRPQDIGTAQQWVSNPINGATHNRIVNNRYPSPSMH